MLRGTDGVTVGGKEVVKMKTVRERLISGTGRWRALVVLVLAVSLTTVGAGLSEAGKSPATLIDRVQAAWSSGNGEAVPSLFASNAEFIDGSGTKYVGRAEIAAKMDQIHGSINWKIKRVATVSARGDYASTFSAWTAFGGSSKGATWDLSQIRNGKVVRHWSMELGQTPPLRNAAR